MNNLEKYLSKFELILWDFDGVIKDSVDVKSDVFYGIFLKYGKTIANRVKMHHEQNGGMSRYEKIPIYLELAGQNSDNTSVTRVCDDFSNKVVEKVVNSPWVKSSKKYLDKYHNKKTFLLITATPEVEINYILKSLKIDNYFKIIMGAPIKKTVAVQKCLEIYNISRDKVVMVGDSNTDLVAAQNNNINFILRKTLLNKEVQKITNLKQYE